MVGVTLDAGPLVAADRGERAFFVWWKLMTRRGIVRAVPATVVAQVWRSPRQARLAQVIAGCQHVPIGLELARSAGEMCGRSGTSDIVDASVVVVAAARKDVILTGDADDLKRLTALVKGTVRIRDLATLPG